MTLHTQIKAASRSYRLVGTQVILVAGAFSTGTPSNTHQRNEGSGEPSQWRNIDAVADIFGSTQTPRVEVIDRFFPRLDGVTLAEQIAITAGFGADDLPGRIWPAFAAFPELISARDEPAARTTHALQVTATVATVLLTCPDIILLGSQWWAEARRDLPDAESRMRTLAKNTGLAIAALADSP